MERDPQDRFEAGNPRVPQPTTGPTGEDQSPASRTMSGATGGDQPLEGQAEQGVGSARYKVGQVADQAKQRVNQAAEQAKQKAGQVKEKASQLKVTVADKLDAGASKLRQKTAGATDELQQSTTDNGTTAQATQKMDKMGGAVATGMEKTANWLRTADMESMRTDIEQQVRTNPGRSLLVAIGLGYVLGRIFRSNVKG